MTEPSFLELMCKSAKGDEEATAALNARIKRRDDWIEKHSKVRYQQSIPQWTFGGQTFTYDPIEGRDVYLYGEADEH